MGPEVCGRFPDPTIPVTEPRKVDRIRQVREDSTARYLIGIGEERDPGRVNHTKSAIPSRMD